MQKENSQILINPKNNQIIVYYHNSSLWDVIFSFRSFVEPFSLNRYIFSHYLYLRSGGEFSIFDSFNVLHRLKVLADNFNSLQQNVEPVSLSQLKMVYLRGIVSYLEAQSGRDLVYVDDWAMARVLFFLKMASGERVNEYYKQEDRGLIYSLNKKDGFETLYTDKIFPKKVEDSNDDSLYKKLEDNSFLVNSPNISNSGFDLYKYIGDLIENLPRRFELMPQRFAIDPNYQDEQTNEAVKKIIDSNFDENILREILCEK